MRTAVPPSTADDLRTLVEELRDRLGAVEHRVVAVEQQLEARDRAHALRDQADADLLAVLADHTRGRPFRAGELLAHAAVDAALAAALGEAGLQSADEIGAWCRDRRGPHGDLAITRHRRRWIVTRRRRDVIDGDPA